MRHAITFTSAYLLVLVSGCSSAPSGSEQSESATDTSEVCEPPDNATPSEMATFTITNNRAEQIYVLPYSSFGCNYGQVEIEVGGAPVLWHHGGTYAYSCSGPLCDYGCSDGGAMGLIINPGATAEVRWSGGLWTRVPLPDACRAEADCLNNEPGETCEVLELVEGEYLVRVNLTDFCEVTEECMACTDGVCEVFFYEPSLGGVSESLEASAVFPAGVEFVVE